MKLADTPQGVVAGSIPLFAGHPAHDLLPIRGVQRTIDALWRKRGITGLFGYGDERGNPDLRDFLVERITRLDGLDIRDENLMIIGGSTWGVNMITGLLTVAGDTVLVDAPSYRDALHIFHDHRLQVCEVPIDDGGIIAREMEKTLEKLATLGRCPRFYYVVPNFQNPSGITMPEDRRRAIVDLSRRYGFAIVEDDVYQDIRFGVTLPPSFYALAGGDNVLRMGTFSKTLAPGLRIGWLIASSERIEQFTGSGVLAMGGGANPFTAAVVGAYCGSGEWEAHVDWLCGRYQQRRDFALQALKASMPANVEWTRPDGGYFIWLTLPASLSVDELAARARVHKVFFAPGTGFFVDSAAGTHHLRLSFSYVPLADLRLGIAILGRLIREMAT